MRKQNSNRKNREILHTLLQTHTHTNIRKYTRTHTENRNERETCFLRQFFLSNPHETCISPHFTTGFPRNGGWTALKASPSVLKSHTKPAFHPWVSPKRSLDSPKTTSNQKKKIPKKTKEFPKQFRTHFNRVFPLYIIHFGGPPLFWECTSMTNRETNGRVDLCHFGYKKWKAIIKMAWVI